MQHIGDARPGLVHYGQGSQGVSDSDYVENQLRREARDGTMAKNLSIIRPKGYLQDVGKRGRSANNSADSTRRVRGLNKLGGAIRKEREAVGLTQRELGNRCGYTYGWLSSIERGISVPTKLMVNRVENALGLEVGKLVGIGEQEGVWKEVRRKGDVGDWGMTITEAANYCLVSRTAMYRLVKEGYIEHVQVDKWRRLRIVDVAKFVIENSDVDIEVSVDDIEKDIKEWLQERRSR